jgi:hypothetical protein
MIASATSEPGKQRERGVREVLHHQLQALHVALEPVRHVLLDLEAQAAAVLLGIGDEARDEVGERFAQRELGLVEHDPAGHLGEIHEVAHGRHRRLGGFADALECLDHLRIDFHLLCADGDRRQALHGDGQLHGDLLDQRDLCHDLVAVGGVARAFPAHVDRARGRIVHHERMPLERLRALLRFRERLGRGHAGERLRRRLDPQQAAERVVGEIDVARGVLDHHRDGHGLRERQHRAAARFISPSASRCAPTSST